MEAPEANGKPVLLIEQETIAKYWPQVEALLATAPIVQEFSTETLLAGVAARQLFCFAFVNEGVVELALVLSPTHSELLPGMTLVTVAGKNLKGYAQKYWEYLKGWCFMNGARAIDAYVPERMEEFLERELGLKKETVHVRLRL